MIAADGVIPDARGNVLLVRNVVEIHIASALTQMRQRFFIGKDQQNARFWELSSGVGRAAGGDSLGSGGGFVRTTWGVGWVFSVRYRTP